MAQMYDNVILSASEESIFSSTPLEKGGRGI